MSNHLHLRLKSCLQTILDLEQQLFELDAGDAMTADMSLLKYYLRQADSMDLAEDDVHKLENATALFLQEIRLPLLRLAQKHAQESGKRVLQ